MKKFLFQIILMSICTVAIAETINLHWLNDNGTTYTESTCTVDDDLIIPTTPPIKYGYTFTGWETLPFTPIEYLESTGTQCVILDYYANPNTKIYADYQLTRTESNQTIFGTRIFGGEMCFCAMASGAGVFGECSFDNNGSSLHNSNTRIDTKRHQLLISGKNNVEYWTDVLFTSSNEYKATKTANYKMSIFADSACSNKSYMKLYSAKIYDNDVLVRDFIPVLDEDGVPCMYDLVEGKVYYNAGTGQFIAGPVIGE